MVERSKVLWFVVVMSKGYFTVKYLSHTSSSLLLDRRTDGTRIVEVLEGMTLVRVTQRHHCNLPHHAITRHVEHRKRRHFFQNVPDLLFSPFFLLFLVLVRIFVFIESPSFGYEQRFHFLSATLHT
jgi:hypothetical protein